MNELQQIEFNMLKEFVSICNKLGLTYYLVCGSALGAAKYGGFIPWDDDIDVALPRSDYEIFCEKAQELLPPHIFLQNHRTDPFYPLIFSKLRNSNTAFFEKAYATTNINHGIYIDIFPLDGYPEDIRLRKKLELEKRRYLLKRICCLDVSKSWRTRLLVALQKLCGIHRKPSRFVMCMEDYIKRYPIYGSDIWCNHGNWQGQLEYAPCTQYGDGVWAIFEGLQVRIPERYDEYLTQKYGDWHSDPPVNDMVGHHYHYICDTNRSYKEFVDVISDRKIKFKGNYKYCF